jgi:hypothetical protein
VAGLGPLRERLTYANVMSTLAVVLVLGGGGAYAAVKLKKNSVTTPKIRKGAVTNPKLAANAVTGDKLAANAVTGGKVADASLSGADVDEATLQGVLSCPAGFARVADVCYQPGFHPAGAVQFPVAVETCAEEGHRLPSVAEAYLAQLDQGPGTGARDYMVDERAGTGMEPLSQTVVMFSNGAIGIQSAPQNSSVGDFTCVTSPTG